MLLTFVAKRDLLTFGLFASKFCGSRASHRQDASNIFVHMQINIAPTPHLFAEWRSGYFGSALRGSSLAPAHDRSFLVRFCFAWPLEPKRAVSVRDATDIPPTPVRLGGRPNAITHNLHFVALIEPRVS